jgi:hypothetical protein
VYPKPLIPKPAVALLACAALIAAAGCGKTDQEQVRELSEDYVAAISKGDFAGACGLFTDAYRQQLGGEVGCEVAQADQFGGPDGSVKLEIAAIKVKGDRGNVGLMVRQSGSPSPLTLLVEKEDGDWLVRGQQ